MTRPLTVEEQAFLAWFFAKMDRSTPGERFDEPAQYCQGWWEEHTGQQLGEDFVKLCHDIADVQ